MASEPATTNQALPSRHLWQASGAGAVGWAGAGQAIAAAAEPVPAIDAHTHFYDPTRPQGVPWPGKGDKTLYRPVLPKELAELAKPQHVGATIVVEASPLVEDNQWLIELAACEPVIIGGVVNPGPAR